MKPCQQVPEVVNQSRMCDRVPGVAIDVLEHEPPAGSAGKVHPREHLRGAVVALEPVVDDQPPPQVGLVDCKLHVDRPRGVADTIRVRAEAAPVQDALGRQRPGVELESSRLGPEITHDVLLQLDAIHALIDRSLVRLTCSGSADLDLALLSNIAVIRSSRAANGTPFAR